VSQQSLSRRALLGGAAALGSTLHGAAPLDKANALDWTLTEAAQQLRSGAISSEELTAACLGRIRTLQPQLNAFITVQEESALETARERDRQRRAGITLGPLHGIPIALKDNIDTGGVLTTAASNVFRERVPSADAEVTRRFKQSGAVLLGKLNLDEMAFEGTGTTSCFGPVHNPWNTERITGGSSAGSAAALSARLCFGSAGTDDGGSVRIPGAFCGVVGFKTTYGRVSTRGIVPSAYSMDTVGPMARSVEDAAVLLGVMAGFDREDTITLPEPVPNYVAALRHPVSSLRVGVARDRFFEGLDPAVERAVEEALRQIRPMVREMRDVKLPKLEIAPEGHYDVELYHFQAPYFEKSPELYHPWSQRQLTQLKTVKTLPYIETLKRVRECRRDIRKVFAEVDLVVLPTMREPAPLLAATLDRSHRRPPSNTSAFNHYGTPAITVPCGFSDDGLPIGLQIAGPSFGEPTVLSLAYQFQRATDWSRRKPPVAS
jgi:aspartyl-tRNA(Asn)/glutamyl-tRNA(Gln) amidotransferase subunit A